MANNKAFNGALSGWQKGLVEIKSAIAIALSKTIRRKTIEFFNASVIREMETCQNL